jgi:hypothetical protein
MKIEYCFLSLETGKSPMKVFSELLRKSEGGILQRVEETHSGFVAAIRVQGHPASGAIYVFDAHCGALFLLDTDEVNRDFTRNELDILVPKVVALLNAPDRPRTAHHRRRHRTRKARTQVVAPNPVYRPAVVAVAA